VQVRVSQADAAVRVFTQAGVENGVGNLVGDLVRMSFGYDSEVNRKRLADGKRLSPQGSF